MEKLYTALVYLRGLALAKRSKNSHLEALLKILVFFEESRIIDNKLGIGNLELHDLVVDRLR